MIRKTSKQQNADDKKIQKTVIQNWIFQKYQPWSWC